MTREPEALSTRTFDIAVIGGGITGACIAHDAALRGLSVVLLEKGDFGAATSAASSKLLHGGIRYLQQFEWGKVRESASERAAFLRIAPHLVRWVPFLIPTTSELSKGRVLLGAGVGLYHLLTAGAGGMPESRHDRPSDGFLDREELLARYPALHGLAALTGAWVIHEAHMYSSERMTLAFVQSARRRGAVALNYAAAERLLRDGPRVTGVLARDCLTNRTWEVAAHFTINATGPWLGAADSGLPHPHLERRITAFSKGVHLVTRRLLPDAAVAVTTPHRSQASIQRGGRHFFIIPWRDHSLIGTTNVPFHGDIEAVGATESDVRTFLDDINAALPGAGLSEDAVRYAFAGLYPLTETEIRPEVYQGTGHYQLVDHAKSGLVGYATALGAKYTTARLLAERAVDLALRGMARPHIPSTTRTEPLSGRRVYDERTERAHAVAAQRDVIDAGVADHLYSQYGDDMAAVVTLGRHVPGGLARLTDSRLDIEATVRFAVRHEMAVTLSDVIFRRTGLGTIGNPGLDCLRRCAAIMAEELRWSSAHTAAEVERTLEAFSFA